MQKIENVIIIKDGKKSSKAYDIIISDGLILDILPSEQTGKEPLFATGGYIDMHTHGGNGLDYFMCTQEASDKVGSFHLNNGTTSYCATSIATPLDELEKQFAIIRKLDNKFATMLGLHLEGPFISFAKKGAQPEENIVTEYQEKDAEFFVRNKDILRIITLCPHTINVAKLVKAITDNGIIANAGHDDSIYPEIIEAVEAGLTGATHIYCASSGIGRRPGDLTKHLGLNETALMDDRIFTEVVADNIHISKPLFLLIYKNKGFKNIGLVSDSLAAAGMPIGNYLLGGNVPVYSRGDVVLLANMKTIAGSITPIAKMVRNVMSYGVPMEEAVYMVNQAPANHLLLKDRGTIEKGKIADINILDSQANIISTYHNGKLVQKNA